MKSIISIWAIVLWGAQYAYSATISTSGCTQPEVESAISAAKTGDIVQVGVGACSWGGLVINKAIHLKGSGSSNTQISITNELNVTKQTTGITRITDFSFSRTGSSSAIRMILVHGAWGAEPVIFQNNKFTVSGVTMLRVESPGGLIFSKNNITAGWDDALLVLKDPGAGEASWARADTFGTRDTTGKLNHYIEDNIIKGGTNTTVDCDDGARCVFRHNSLTYSAFGSHGMSTSPIGMRHFEIYNNTWLYPTSECSSPLANQNWLVRIRGATGVIFNNVMPDIAGPCGWGDKPEIRFDLRGAEDVRPQGTCENTKYPVPRQLGQNHNGINYFTDPIYVWGNSGGNLGFGEGFGWGNPCGFNWSDFFQWGRDAINGQSKPGYSAYTYPHPLLGVTNPTPPPSGKTVRSTPTTIKIRN